MVYQQFPEMLSLVSSFLHFSTEYVWGGGGRGRDGNGKNAGFFMLQKIRM